MSSKRPSLTPDILRRILPALRMKVCSALLADPAATESRACAMVGIKSGTWAYFKLRHFGKGPISREKLVTVLKAAGVELPDTPAPSAAPAPVAEQPAAPAAPEVVMCVNGRAEPVPDSARNVLGFVKVEEVRRRLHAEREKLLTLRQECDHSLLIATARVETADEIYAALKGAA